MREAAQNDSLPGTSTGMESSDQAAHVEWMLAEVLSDASSGALIGTGGRMTPRLGVDVVDLDVLARQLSSRVGSAFRLRIFTEAEIADCRDQVAKFATRWAVKEAVSKAIGTGFRQGLSPGAIEVLKAPNGSIRVAPAVGCTWPDGAADWTWTVSAAHERGVAVAVAIAFSNV